MKIFGVEFGFRASPSDEVEVVPENPPFMRLPRHALARQGHARSYEVGSTDRLVASWTRSDRTVNQSLLKDLRVMRARSRDFFRNNEFGRKFASLIRINVVGSSGFNLKVDCKRQDGSTDQEDSDRVRGAYLRWCKKGQHDVTGRYSEKMLDRLIVTMIARDGEVLIRLVEGADKGIHNCQLQLLSGHVLDEELNRDLNGGRRIRMGVEFDEWMKPAAYWLRKESKNSDIHGAWTQRYDRVPAEEVIHLFIAEEENQWRGAPWAYAALRRAKQLDQYDEAALVAANVGAGKMGFFQQKDPEAGAPIRADDEDGESEFDDDQDFISESAPGQFDVIPDGYELTEWDPDYPHANYDPFVKAISRTIATGCLVSYHGMTGDLTQVNFSSIRSGTLDEREMWKELQSWLIESFKEPVFEWWLARAMMFDRELKRLPFTQFDKFNAPVFIGRRWDWVDPKSDVVSAREAVSLGVKSRARIIREMGLDPEEVWDELEAEEARGFSAPRASGAPPRNDDDDR
ncbi:MAG: phage portal protein [Pseudomonadota bacterium]